MRPFKTPFLFAAFTLSLLAATKASSEQSPSLTDSTELFKEWIAMEKLVSKENSDWELVKNPMKDLIEVLSEERSSIDEKLTITKLNTLTNAYDSYLTVDNWGDHADNASNYSDRAT